MRALILVCLCSCSADVFVSVQTDSEVPLDASDAANESDSLEAAPLDSGLGFPDAVKPLLTHCKVGQPSKSFYCPDFYWEDDNYNDRSCWDYCSPGTVCIVPMGGGLPPLVGVCAQ